MCVLHTKGSLFEIPIFLLTRMKSDTTIQRCVGGRTLKARLKCDVKPYMGNTRPGQLCSFF